MTVKKSDDTYLEKRSEAEVKSGGIGTRSERISLHLSLFPKTEREEEVTGERKTAHLLGKTPKSAVAGTRSLPV